MPAYESPSIERVGGDDQVETLGLVFYLIILVAGGVVAVAVVVAVAAVYAITWFWGPKN